MPKKKSLSKIPTTVKTKVTTRPHMRMIVKLKTKLA